MSFGGWYLFTLRTVTVANVPVLGDLQTVTESRMVAHFVEEGGQIQGSHEVCGVDVIGATTLAETILPEAFVRALPTSHYTLDLSEDEGVHGISGDLALVHIGYNPSLGPVPSNSQDANVLDTDDDGLLDGEEIEYGSDPLNRFSWPDYIWPDNRPLTHPRNSSLQERRTRSTRRGASRNPFKEQRSPCD